MPRATKARAPEVTFISVKVDTSKACTTAGINLDLLASGGRYASSTDLVFRYETTIELSGICNYPEERAGERYDVTIYTAQPNSPNLAIKVSDLQEEDRHGAPMYKTLKSGSYPVYRESPAMGFLEKIRGEPRFTMTIWVAPVFVSDALTLLTQHQPKYLSLQEKRIERKRMVTHFSVQDSDPSQE